MHDIALRFGWRSARLIAVLACFIGATSKTSAETGYWKFKNAGASALSEELDGPNAKETGQRVRGSFDPGASGVGAGSLQVYAKVRACKKQSSKRLDICVFELKLELASSVNMSILKPGQRLGLKTALTVGENDKLVGAGAHAVVTVSVGGDIQKDALLISAEIGKTGKEEGELVIPDGRPEADLSIDAVVFSALSGEDYYSRLAIAYEWASGSPPAPAVVEKRADPEPRVRVAAQRIIDEPALGFTLRIPAGWDFERRETNGKTVWVLDNSDRSGASLLQVVVAVLEQEGKGPMEALQETARAWAENLTDGKVSEFGPFRMGDMSGLSTRLTGFQKFGDAPPIAVSILGLQFDLNSARLGAVAIAPAAAAGLLDTFGQPGSIFGPSDAPRADPQPAPTEAGKPN